MAWRNIDIALRADTSNYEQGMKRSSDTTRRFRTEQEQAVTKSRANMQQLGQGAMVVGGAMVAGFGLAVNASAQFERQLSELGAVSGASSSEMGRLRAAVLEAGAATVFSAGEAAQGATELAKAGVSTADILGGGLTGALNLAAAGNLSLARAAEIAAAGMNTFGLAGSDVPRIADTLAAAANKSAADVEDIGMALQQSGLVADQFGLTIEETSGILAMFSQAGLNGSDAGTSFKTMLQRLVPQSVEAASMMHELNLQFFDSEGAFTGIASVAEQLQDRLGSLSDEQRATALSTLFGADAVRGATILMEGGAEAVGRWTENVTDQGYAADLAAEKLDNLAGDLESLRGSLETTLIGAGSQANGVMRTMVQTATDLVNGLGGLPAPIQTTATAVSGLGGGLLFLGGGIAYLKPKVDAAREALAAMGTAGATANTVLGKVGPAAAIAAVGLGVVAAELGRIDAEVAEVVASATADLDLTNMEDLGTAVERLSEQVREAQQAADPGFWNIQPWWETSESQREANEMGEALDRLVFRMRMAGAEAEVVQRNLTGWKESMPGLTAALGLSEEAVRELADRYDIDLSGAYRDLLPALQAVKAEQQASVETTGHLSDATGDLGEDVGDLEEQLGGETEAAKAARDAHEKWLESLEGINDSFLDPVGTWNDLLQDNAQELSDNANEVISWWNATHDGADKAATSWEDFRDRAVPAIDEYMDKLREQVQAQTEWRTNLGIIAMRAGEDVASEMAGWGPEAAGLIAEMAKASDAELQAFVNDVVKPQMANAAGAVDTEMQVMAAYGRQGGRATAEAISEETGVTPQEVQRIISEANGLLGLQMGVMNEIARQGAHATYRSVADELGLTPAEVRTIMANAGAEQTTGMRIMTAAADLGAAATVWAIATRLGVTPGIVRDVTRAAGLELQEGINPLLGAVGASRVTVYANARGAVFEDHSPQIGDGRVVRLWNEPETGGEAYLPKFGDRSRGRAILNVAADWYDMAVLPKDRVPDEFRVRRFATGGVLTGDFANMFMSSADLPPTPEFDPLAFPLETGYKAGWEYMRGEVGAWIDRTLAATSFAGDAGGLNPILLGKFNLWNALTGGGHYIVSGYRSYAEQAALYARYLAGDPSLTLVAPPGSSNHQLGLAIDHAPDSTAYDRPVGYALGVHWPVPREPWHMEVVGMPRSFTPFSYDQGGWLPQGLSLAYNGTGAPEPVGMPNVNVNVEARVFMGDREITDIVRVESRVVASEVMVDGVNRMRRGFTRRPR
ncbi:MAG TPA: phage tail tape measure protein [Acidimicrobiales bacterium]|jgi:TP901 family phage tail tape measure protein